MSGNSLAIVIGFIFTPFITRIYSPEAYGVFALYGAIVQGGTLFATLQLTRAFVLPGSDFEFRQLLRATWISTCLLVTLSWIVLYFFNGQILSYLGLGASLFRKMWIFIPIGIFLYSVNDILKSHNVRNKVFSRNSGTQIFSSISARGTTLLYGIYTAGHAPGLIFGDLLTKLIEVFLLTGNTLKKEVQLLFSNFNWIEMRIVSHYRNYPLFVLPSVGVQVLTFQSPIYIATFFFSTASAGQYSLANSLINLPLNLLVGSIAPVFLQKINETIKSKPLDAVRIVHQLVDRLFIIGLLPMAGIVVFGDWIFRIVLGEQWIDAGNLARYMGLYSFFQIVNLPLISIFRVLNRERLGLAMNLLTFLLSTVGLIVGLVFDSFLLCIVIFSFSIMLTTLASLFVQLKISGLDPFKKVFTWMVVFAITIGLAFGIRTLIEFWVK